MILRGEQRVHEYQKAKLGDVTKLIKIQTVGPFSVRGPNDEDLTPNGAKACALLAILALTDEKSRPRRFLEEKLWSSRAPEQAGAKSAPRADANSAGVWRLCRMFQSGPRDGAARPRVGEC